ncbi:NAD-dependent protein deacetylase hst1 [Venturia nashicola]|uniref:NAD-dependent protein deacetylase hst1 n=1 Tax=Venturia nashicola TaxID=86259 RepID=A0A4Z1NZL2_9PEZI|nr:NAD-dependent protein deacetylase hst1 [Venturia nashicola]
MDLLYGTLHSGNVGSMHWVFNKISCDNRYLCDPGLRLPSSLHRLSQLVHLLNERVSKTVYKPLQLIELWQKALDRRAVGARRELDEVGQYDMTTFAKWEGNGVLIMRPKQEGDSDQATLSAIRRIEGIRLGYNRAPTIDMAYQKHHEYIMANAGSALLR